MSMICSGRTASRTAPFAARVIGRLPKSVCTFMPVAVPDRKVRPTDEIRHEFADRVAVDLVRGADLHHAPAVHHRDAVGQRRGLFLVVGHQNAGGAGLFSRRRTSCRVSTRILASRFEKGSSSKISFRARRRAPSPARPAVAGRRKAGAGAACPGRTDRQGAASRRRGPAPGRGAGARSPNLTLSSTLRCGKQRIVLKDEADATGFGRQVGDVVALKVMRPLVGLLEPADHPEGGCLAAARRPQQRQQLAIAQRQRDACTAGASAWAKVLRRRSTSSRGRGRPLAIAQRRGLSRHPEGQGLGQFGHRQ